MLLLVNIMSWAPALAGVGVTIILVPAGSFVSRRLAAIRRQIVACTDARMKLTTEVLLGIKTIKCAAPSGSPVHGKTSLKGGGAPEI